MPRVFFITGTSTGFGNHLVQEVIDRGDVAIATARKPETLSFKNTNAKASSLNLPSSYFLANTHRITSPSSSMLPTNPKSTLLSKMQSKHSAASMLS
jgi:NAD(P)-dependent dehydrogenase (short-subunit alcohol dehydrogenase family)